MAAILLWYALDNDDDESLGAGLFFGSSLVLFIMACAGLWYLDFLMCGFITTNATTVTQKECTNFSLVVQLCFVVMVFLGLWKRINRKNERVYE